MTEDFEIEIQGEKKRLIGYHGTETQINIPDGIDEIGECAFCDNQTIRSVVFSNSVIKICRSFSHKRGAFSNCQNLSTVILNEKLEEIERLAFWGCNKLENLVLPKNLKSIGAYAFPKDAELIVKLSGEFNIPQPIPSECVVHLYLYDHSDNIQAILYIPDHYQKEPYQEFVERLSKGQISHLSEYDELFHQSEQIIIRKIKVALDRLRYPLELEEKYWQRYIKYLRKHARLIVPRLIESSDIPLLSVLAEVNALQPEYIDAYFDQASKLPEMEPRAILINYKERIRDKVHPIGLEIEDTGKVQSIWEYEENEDETLTITRYNGSEIEVTVPSSIDGRRVTRLEGSIGSLKVSIFHPNSIKIQSVSIEEGIEEIGKRAFQDCSNLVSVSIPASVKALGQAAFAGCSRLVLVFSEPIQKIGGNALKEVKNIEIEPSLLLKLKMEDIGLEDVYINLIDEKGSRFASLYIPTEWQDPQYDESPEQNGYPELIKSFSQKNEIDYRGYDALFLFSPKHVMEKWKIALGRLAYPVELSNNARDTYVSYLKAYNHLILPEFIRHGDLAVVNLMVEIGAINQQYLELYINEARDFFKEDIEQILVEYRDRNPIRKEPGFEEIAAGDSSPTWQYEDNCLRWYLGNQIDIIIPSRINGQRIKRIQSSEEALDFLENVFGVHAPNLISVTLQEGIEIIGGRAFYESHNLKHVKLPSSLKEIRDQAFLGCERLNSIDIPSGVVLSTAVFSYCVSLTSFKFPEGTRVIDSRTFFGCKNLKSVELPESLETIFPYAFAGCSSLSKLYIPGSVTKFIFEAPEHFTEVPIHFIDCPNLVIHSPKGSHAIEYAKQWDLKYVEI